MPDFISAPIADCMNPLGKPRLPHFAHLSQKRRRGYLDTGVLGATNDEYANVGVCAKGG
jgi:hypothetical protein